MMMKIVDSKLKEFFRLHFAPSIKLLSSLATGLGDANPTRHLKMKVILIFKHDLKDQDQLIKIM